MKRYIHIQKEDREFIARAFKVSKRTVYNAINFEDMNEGNDLARRIRTLALQRGGVVMLEVPEVETLHDEAGCCMTQQFDNGAVLRFDKRTGDCTLLHRGEVVDKWYDVKVSQILGIQNVAVRL